MEINIIIYLTWHDKEASVYAQWLWLHWYGVPRFRRCLKIPQIKGSVLWRYPKCVSWVQKRFLQLYKKILLKYSWDYLSCLFICMVYQRSTNLIYQSYKFCQKCSSVYDLAKLLVEISSFFSFLWYVFIHIVKLNYDPLAWNNHLYI